jgi:hypothetical protein
VKARSVVIVEVRGQSPLQMTTVQDHEVIQALPSYRSDQALRVGILPGTPRLSTSSIRSECSRRRTSFP